MSRLWSVGSGGPVSRPRCPSCDCKYTSCRIRHALPAPRTRLSNSFQYPDAGVSAALQNARLWFSMNEPSSPWRGSASHARGSPAHICRSVLCSHASARSAFKRVGPGTVLHSKDWPLPSGSCDLVEGGTLFFLFLFSWKSVTCA